MEIIFIVLMLSPLALLAIGMLWLQNMRAREILQEWAQREKFAVVSARICYIKSGPFAFDRMGGQLIYQIVVKDQQGLEHRGWVRVGGWLLGILTKEVKVIWGHSEPSSSGAGRPRINR